MVLLETKQEVISFPALEKSMTIQRCEECGRDINDLCGEDFELPDE